MDAMTAAAINAVIKLLTAKPGTNIAIRMMQTALISQSMIRRMASRIAEAKSACNMSPQKQKTHSEEWVFCDEYAGDLLISHATTAQYHRPSKA